MICLDTNIIYSFLFETELTSASEKIIREAIVEGMAIPMIVYNELLYTTGAKIARIKYGVKGKYSFRKHIAKHGFPEEAIEKVNGFIRDFKVTILRDYQDPDEIIKTIKAYRLAPNDAQIALTCKHKGVETLATFDEDFKRVPWLKVIP
ncbi:MAG: PIN domain-containing protein [Desulfurococcales archaeon]|nr:PIN domain-containing protein [Desulfurococcales archaeon]